VPPPQTHCSVSKGPRALKANSNVGGWMDGQAYARLIPANPLHCVMQQLHPLYSWLQIDQEEIQTYLYLHARFSKSPKIVCLINTNCKFHMGLLTFQMFSSSFFFLSRQRKSLATVHLPIAQGACQTMQTSNCSGFFLSFFASITF
jgi:hypothetical protein